MPSPHGARCLDVIGIVGIESDGHAAMAATDSEREGVVGLHEPASADAAESHSADLVDGGLGIHHARTAVFGRAALHGVSRSV